MKIPSGRLSAMLWRSLEHSKGTGGGQLGAAEHVAMMQTQQLRRRSCWGLWIGTGAMLGGTVVGGLAVVLCLVDTEAAAADYIAPAAMVAGTLGAIGGAFAGAASAVITWLLDQLTGGLTAAGYATVSATVTAGVAGAVGMWLIQPGSLIAGNPLSTWVLMPVVISAAVAAIAGGYLWRHAFDH